MTKRSILQRKRIFIGGEGESEQSFIKWLYDLSNQECLHVHLHCQPLGGGGYRTMLDRAVCARRREERDRTKFKSSVLLVDGDRAARGDDGWTIDQLKQEASKQRFAVCVQNPNFEGLLIRMLTPGREKLQLEPVDVQRQLRALWPDYQKAADAQMLESKFSLNDLLRVASVDQALKSLLMMIGFSL